MQCGCLFGGLRCPTKTHDGTDSCLFLCMHCNGWVLLSDFHSQMCLPQAKQVSTCLLTFKMAMRNPSRAWWWRTLILIVLCSRPCMRFQAWHSIASVYSDWMVMRWCFDIAWVAYQGRRRNNTACLGMIVTEEENFLHVLYVAVGAQALLLSYRFHRSLNQGCCLELIVAHHLHGCQFLQSLLRRAQPASHHFRGLAQT